MRQLVRVSLKDSFLNSDIKDCSISFTLSSCLGGSYAHDEVKSFLKPLGIPLDSVEDIRVY